MEEKNEPYNCLINELVIVRHINKQRGSITDPNHVLYGGMAERAVRVFTVPRLSSGSYVNVLTNNEKACLEQAMGLEFNALSVHKKENNFWSDNNATGVNRVRLTKQDVYLNLSDPEDYIRYKILLANKDYIAPSLQALQDKPKATYQFVIIRQNDETKQAKLKMSTTAQCYKEFGKIENNADVLRLIVETIDGRAWGANTDLEFLQTKVHDYIQSDSKTFLSILSDKLLDYKVIIRKAVDHGLIFKKGDWYYLKADNSPLCEEGEDPTFNMAAKYISNPKHQDVKFALEAKMNNQ